MAHITENNAKLIIVDDDELFCQVLAKALTKRGFEVSVAYNIEQCLYLAQENKPQYAVVDLRIGEASGLQVVSALKNQNAAINILVLTGYASVATAVEAIKLGAVHYMAKPVDADEIVTALHRNQGDPSVLTDNRPSPKRMEWEYLQKMLIEHDGNISATARALGMHRRTLQRKLQKKPVNQ